MDWHRDGRNARIFASTYMSGMNFSGGELILPELGHALCGSPGYSVHAPYDILIHGVGKIRPDPVTAEQHLPPVRALLAMYPQASVYAGAARFSGSLKPDKVFSDPALWLPFYPRGFKVQRALDVFKTEEKRLHDKYRDEVRDYQTETKLQEAAEAAKKKAEEEKKAAEDQPEEEGAHQN